MLSTKRIPVAVPSLNGNEKKYVNECLDSTWISSAGEFIGRFEKSFADFCGVRHAVAINNGTTINLEHVAIFELIVRREAVDYFVVHRGADVRRETVVTKEVAGGVVAFEHLAEGLVELFGSHTRTSHGHCLIQSFSQHQSGLAHLQDLGVGLVLDFRLS